MDYGKRPPLDEQKSLWQATIAAEGVTTAAGEGTGLSLIAAGLAGAGANSFVSMMAIIYPGDPTRVDSKDITAFNTGTGEVTVASIFKGGQVAAGVPYKIVTFRFVPAEVAAIEAKLDHASHGLAALKALIDAVQADATAILLDTGTTIPGTITTLQTAVTGIQNDLDNATDGLGALKALIDAVQADATAILLDTGTTIPGTITTLQATATSIQNDLDNATDGLGALKALIDAAQADITAILLDTGTTIPGTITTLQTAVTGIQNDLDNATDGLGALKALIDNLDADLVAHEASQATHRAVLVDIHDTDLPAVKTVVDDIEVKLDAGGLGAGRVTKALTFANQTGQVALFTVTGDVIARIVAVVKTGCATGTACNVSVGIAADVDAIIPVTDITLLAAQEIWHDTTPDSEIEALGSMREHIITDGNDITLNSSAADNSGAITFYCFWTALSSGATVVAA